MNEREKEKMTRYEGSTIRKRCRRDREQYASFISPVRTAYAAAVVAVG